MGREIRRVPPNWEHPQRDPDHDTYRHGGYQPMFNQRFEDAAAEWKSEFAAWERGERPDYCTAESKDSEYWEFNGDPPTRAYYRPYRDDEATWFQVYETVSEGTPVTPPFETKSELVDYLVKHGDFWDQKRGDGAWKRDVAEAFVADGFAPSLVVTGSPRGASVKAPRDGQFLDE